jgi:hypothetical protein
MENKKEKNEEIELNITKSTGSDPSSSKILPKEALDSNEDQELKLNQDENKETLLRSPIQTSKKIENPILAPIETSKSSYLKPILKKEDIGFLDKTVDLNADQGKFLIPNEFKENKKEKPEIKFSNVNFEVDIENEQANNEKINSNFGLLCSINQAPSTEKVYILVSEKKKIFFLK